MDTRLGRMSVLIGVALGGWHFGGKSEAPRAALLAEACAPPEATPGSEGDPPPIVPRALASVSTNDITRRSLRFGG